VPHLAQHENLILTAQAPARLPGHLQPCSLQPHSFFSVPGFPECAPGPLQELFCLQSTRGLLLHLETQMSPARRYLSRACDLKCLVPLHHVPLLLPTAV
jgi:hypothetical protein